MLLVRNAGPTIGGRALWVVTEAGDDATLQGPDRLGNHASSFDTFLDASHAAQWRVEQGLDEGPVRKGGRW